MWARQPSRREVIVFEHPDNPKTQMISAHHFSMNSHEKKRNTLPPCPASPRERAAAPAGRRRARARGDGRTRRTDGARLTDGGVAMDALVGWVLRLYRVRWFEPL